MFVQGGYMQTPLPSSQREYNKRMIFLNHETFTKHIQIFKDKNTFTLVRLLEFESKSTPSEGVALSS